MVKSSEAAAEPKKNDELDAMARKSDELARRAKEGRVDYRLTESEIVKTKPDPLPQSLKDQLRDLQASRTSIHTEATSKEAGYVTDSSMWLFSGQSFSPRSVVSVNGASKEEEMLRVRSSTDHLRQVPDVAAVRRDYNEAYARRIERYNSLPQLTQPSAVIQVKDDKPRSIMKRRELENREQMLYPAENYRREVVREVVRRPVKTETVQRFEQTRRTEEVERRVQRKERKDRRSRHHSSSRREEWRDGGHGGSDDELRIRREREMRELREHDEWEKMEHERRLREERELLRKQTRKQSNASAQVELGSTKQPVVIYQRRALTQEELQRYLQEAYSLIQRANYASSQWRSSSLSRHGGYLPSNESYFRQTTTKRDNSNSRGGGWEDDRFGSGIAHARYGSLSDSLRRGELKYVPNGEVRESHWRDGGGRSGHSVHKSYSTRDVFDDRAFDHHSMASHGGRRSSQGTQPLVEFPPTLPRRGRDDDFRPMHKARSFADWDDQGRAGWRHEESALQHRRRDDDMSRLEDEFRDSLLMPMPNGNMHERDHRTEQIPGGYETHHKENRSNAGRRVNRDGVPVDFNEATQEYSYKREQETDRRR
ncbi:unnamed protein product, partial [Mesorhabditis belari]|uniref:Uncharacterized protein n=1 Tax=Mesorhabditis belari TaxID=2138241 RepID=A0AAF3J200_9BILA